jgi:hypothetical protein
MKAVWRRDSSTELFMNLSTFWTSRYIVEIECVLTFSAYDHLFPLRTAHTDTNTHSLLHIPLLLTL